MTEAHHKSKLPRLHFSGICQAQVPTGNNGNDGSLNTATLELFMGTEKVADGTTPEEFQHYQQSTDKDPPKSTRDRRWDLDDGANDPDGKKPFGNKGSGFCQYGTNNTYFWLEVTAVQIESKDLLDNDIIKTYTKDNATGEELIGKDVVIAGHTNPYTGSTCNPGRMVDTDPCSNWTPAIFSGMFSIGNIEENLQPGAARLTAKGNSKQCAHDLSFTNLVLNPTGPPTNPKWDMNTPDMCGVGSFQFVIGYEDINFQKAKKSKFLTAIKKLRPDGIAVKYTLYNMGRSTGGTDGAWLQCVGTVVPWYQHEPKHVVVGRRLVPDRSLYPKEEVGWMPQKFFTFFYPGPCTVWSTRVGKNHFLTLDLKNCIPWATTNRNEFIPLNAPLKRAKPTATPQIPVLADKVGTGLELVWTNSHNPDEKRSWPIAHNLYDKRAYETTAGIVDVSIEHEAFVKLLEGTFSLWIVWPDKPKQQILKEWEHFIVPDEKFFYIEPVRDLNIQELNITTYRRGVPASYKFEIRQYYNTLGYPDKIFGKTAPQAYLDNPETEQDTDPSKFFYTVEFCDADSEEDLWYPALTEVVSSDKQGQIGKARIRVRTKNSGASIISFSVDREKDVRPPTDWDRKVGLFVDGQTAMAQWQYDNDFFNSAYWSYANMAVVRVMPDDGDLADVLEASESELTYEYVYKNILRYYEMVFPFMAHFVFSFRDKASVVEFAALIKAVTARENLDKTFYMPPTRELSDTKRKILSKYCDIQVAKNLPAPSPTIPPQKIEGLYNTREELIIALQQACRLEHEIMIQYLYAAWSIPKDVDYMRKQGWTDEQIKLVMGDPDQAEVQFGGKGGWKNTLIAIAHQEMLHLLLATNLLVAIGGTVNFKINGFPYHPSSADIRLDVEFGLTPLNVGSVYRFMKIEWPDYGPWDAHPDERWRTLNSVSSFYEKIRNSLDPLNNALGGKLILQTIPGRNNWNLFMPASFVQQYPNWDASIANIEDAKFAVDVITLEGEGSSCNKSKDQCGPAEDNQDAHFFRFYEMYIQLLEQEVKSAKEEQLHRPPWSPCYPVISNPSETGDRPGTHKIIDHHSSKVLKLFNESYKLMLQMLTFAWTTENPRQAFRLGKVFNLGIDLMLGVMKPLGEYLCSSCPSGYKGYHAGPSFEIGDLQLGAIPVSDVALGYFEEQLKGLITFGEEVFGTSHNRVIECYKVILAKFEKEGIDFAPPDTPPHVAPSLTPPSSPRTTTTTTTTTAGAGATAGDHGKK